MIESITNESYLFFPQDFLVYPLIGVTLHLSKYTRQEFNLIEIREHVYQSRWSVIEQFIWVDHVAFM